MIELDSSEWETLSVPAGSAKQVPVLLAALQNNPSTEAFDSFWDELTGEGDLCIHDAFFAALPHAIMALKAFEGEALEQAVAQLGWGVALAGDGEVPPRFTEDFREARLHLKEIAIATSQKGVSPVNQDWMKAAIEAGSGRFSEALAIIDEL